MELEWESNFKTGNETVDLQHRSFVELINSIGTNFRETDDDAYKENLISSHGVYWPKFTWPQGCYAFEQQ